MKFLGIYCLLFLFIPRMIGQDTPTGPERPLDVPADTTLLEQVSISVLPFRVNRLEAAGAVYAVSGDEIKRENGIVSTGLYNSAPGVFLASGALNTHRVVIRGIGSRTPYNSNRIRAYLDDIPLTSGDGISTLEDQDILAIGSMEVLKGPSSALYGSGLGGVIRLNSPYPAQPGWNSTLTVEAGSYGSRRYAITGQYKKGAMALSGGLARTSSSGFRDNSDYLRNSVFLHARLFGNNHQLSMTLSLTDLHAGIPSSLNKADYLNEPEKAGGTWGILNGFEEYIKILGGIRLESDLGANLKNSLIVSASFSDPYERRPFNILDEKSSSIGFREFVKYDSRHFKLGAGIEYYHESFQWNTFETLPDGKGILISDQGEIRKYLNSFISSQWRPSGSILVDAGLNLNLLSYGITTHYRIDSTDQGGAYDYSPVFSPRIGFSFLHGKSMRTYVSAGHGFSAPSLEETLLPEGMVNTSLRPESGWNLDLGNRGILLEGQFEYDLTLYSILLEDLLVTERVAEDIFTGVNAGSAWNRGLEILVRGNLFQDKDAHIFNAGIQTSYHLSRNTFRHFIDDGMDYSGNELPGIPQQVFRTELTGMMKGLSLRIQHSLTGQQWMDDANEKRYEAYQLAHVQLNWEPDLDSSPFQLKLYGGVRNLFDTHHASMILINAPSFGGRAPRYYYPGSPRHYYLGISLSIER